MQHDALDTFNFNSMTSAIAIAPNKPADLKRQEVIYFPGLNALRYIAAALVIIGHVEEFKSKYNLPNYYGYPAIHDSGPMAVTFFFVLSGFLITYLLLKEKQAYQTINIKSFYFRRALRIWPVYYLISALGLFVLPFVSALSLPHLSSQVISDYPTNTLLYFLFLPNVALIAGYFVPYASHLWSVGVEEQFYLFWPWIFNLSGKKLLPIISGIIVAFFILRTGSDVLSYHWLSESHRKPFLFIYKLISATRLDCMAIGGLGAYFIYTNQHWFRQYFINKGVEILSLALTLALLFKPLPYIQYDIQAIAFLLLIVNISCNEGSLFRLEGRAWTFLGNISYSVYMYQYLVIGLVLLGGKMIAVQPVGIAASISFHLIIQIVTIAFAYLSYRYFESPFMKYKKRFMKVKSTDNSASV